MVFTWYSIVMDGSAINELLRWISILGYMQSIGTNLDRKTAMKCKSFRVSPKITEKSEQIHWHDATLNILTLFVRISGLYCFTLQNLHVELFIGYLTTRNKLVVNDAFPFRKHDQ